MVHPSNIADFPERRGSGFQHDSNDIELPDPKSIVDKEFVRNLASTQLTAQMERRAENAKFHDRRARQIFRRLTAAVRAKGEAIDWNLSQLRPSLQQTKKSKSRLERFDGSKKLKEGEKQPASRWTQMKFGAAVLLWVLSLLNGAFTVAGVMMDSTAFSGQLLKAYSVGLGLFLMPSFGCYAVFHFLRNHKRVARAYLLILTCCGLLLFFLFSLSWAYTYAMETGNETLLDLTTIGLSGQSEEEVHQPWFFENADWLTVLFQILADAAFAGLAKAYMALLATEYALFFRKSFQQDPQWVVMDQEERELVRQIGEEEGKRKNITERLEALDDQQDDFVASVCEAATALFNSEVDAFEERIRRGMQLDREEARREREYRAAQENAQKFHEENPGMPKEDRFEQSA